MIANILQPLIDVLHQVLQFFGPNGGGPLQPGTIGLSWGMAIIALTVTIRVILLPLTLKQSRSLRKMQVLQPQLKELQAKYKDDKPRLNEEMMKFYKEHKVNPLASCFPLLLQLPFFISLFYMLRHDLRHDICGQTAKVCGDVPHVAGQAAEGFLGIPDLTAPAHGAVLVVLLILYVGSQLISGIITMVGADKTQRNIMLALPLVFATFVVTFPAGLVVYWITTNVWTIFQQYLVRKRVGGPVRPAKKEEEGKGTAAPAGAPAVALASGAGGGGGGGGSGGNGKATPAPSNGSGTNGARAGGPPPPPRRRKKRSGRRR
jgi:YidC/Oxa1 family membrane protein insertase